MVVPFPASGPADVLARILSERMRVSLGQTVVVENLAGAAGSIAVGRVARAAPDGYTLILGNLGTHVFNGAIYSLGYDLVNDFEAVALLPSNNQLIIASNATPASRVIRRPLQGDDGAGNGGPRIQRMSTKTPHSTRTQLSVFTALMPLITRCKVRVPKSCRLV